MPGESDWRGSSNPTTEWIEGTRLMSAIGLLAEGVRRYFDFFDFKADTAAG